jgi:hypothetical protein
MGHPELCEGSRPPHGTKTPCHSTKTRFLAWLGMTATANPETPLHGRGSHQSAPAMGIFAGASSKNERFFQPLAGTALAKMPIAGAVRGREPGFLGSRTENFDTPSNF